LRKQDLFLPDFCHIRSVFALVMTGQLLAFVLVLAAPADDVWQRLSLVSLFVQWIVLSSAALLCVSRGWLARLGNAGAGVVSYLMVLAVTGLVSELGYRLLDAAAPAEVRHGFMLRSLAIAAIVTAVTWRYLYVVHEGRRRLAAEAAARIEALQARIRPHFLFNSLNTIASMIAYAPDKAEAAVEDLADLFRASLAKPERLVTLAEELKLAEGYLRMEALRLGERLRVEWAVDALPRDALLPPLTLQPLLENAVYYGIEPRVDGGTIRIDGGFDGRRLRLRVVNPCADLANGARRGGHGMAQDNVRQRLSLALGKDASLRIANDGGGEYQVELVLPYRTTTDEDIDRR